jgi:hypothetical protein
MASGSSAAERRLHVEIWTEALDADWRLGRLASPTESAGEKGWPASIRTWIAPSLPSECGRSRMPSTTARKRASPSSLIWCYPEKSGAIREGSGTFSSDLLGPTNCTRPARPDWEVGGRGMGDPQSQTGAPAGALPLQEGQGLGARCDIMS